MYFTTEPIPEWDVSVCTQSLWNLRLPALLEKLHLRLCKKRSAVSKLFRLLRRCFTTQRPHYPRAHCILLQTVQAVDFMLCPENRKISSRQRKFTWTPLHFHSKHWIKKGFDQNLPRFVLTHAETKCRVHVKPTQRYTRIYRILRFKPTSEL